MERSAVCGYLTAFPFTPLYSHSDMENRGSLHSAALRSKIILGGMHCQRLWSPTLATQEWGTLDPLEVRIQNRSQSWVPHIWRALCARCGAPQLSPLRSGRDDKVRCNRQPSLSTRFSTSWVGRGHERSDRKKIKPFSNRISMRRASQYRDRLLSAALGIHFPSGLLCARSHGCA